MTVYVVGQYKGETSLGGAWELGGIYDSPELARAACIDRDWFTGPVEMNQPLPVERTTWPGCEYPNGQFESEAEYLEWLSRRN